MSDITFNTTISAPELGSPSYGDNIQTQFKNIDDNFKQIVEGEYLKGQSGDIVMLEEIDLTSDSDICTKFYDFLKVLFYEKNKDDEENEEIVKNIKKSIGDGNEEDDINSSKLYMIYTLNQENGEKIYKTSLPYTFLDPRFNPVTNSVKDENLEDKSCIIIYDGDTGKSEETGETGGFKSYKAFPNIYFNGDQNEFCWKINGLKTSLPARGPKGDTGYAGSFYVLQAGEANMGDGYYKVLFMITPETHKGYLGEIQGEDLVSELEGQCAFVYHTDSGGYLTTIERHQEGNEVYAKCRLDAKLNVYDIFSGESLVDTLISNTIEDNGYGSLFLPVEKDNGEVLAHTLSTKLSNDRVGTDETYYNTTKKEDLVLSPGIFKKVNVEGETRWERTLAPIIPFVFVNNYPVSRFPHKTVFNITETNEASFNKTETNEATISKSLISSNLCKDKNNVITPWIELVESSVISHHIFPRSTVDKKTINDAYAAGVTFVLNFSIGELSTMSIFRKPMNDTDNGYDVMLVAVKNGFKDFIESCKGSDPSNPSYQWDPEAEISDGFVKMRYDGDFFELQNPEELIIAVTVQDIGLKYEYSYNPKDLAKPNKIKINGNVEIPGTVKTTDLLLNDQTLDNRIDSKIDDVNQSLLLKYFTEEDSMTGGEKIHVEGSNEYCETASIKGGYRHPIQLYVSPASTAPRNCEYHQTMSQNTSPATYRIEIDLTGAQSYISHLRFQTKFKALGAANDNTIFIVLSIKDLNGNVTTWKQTQIFFADKIYDVDTTMTFKNDKVQVPGFIKQ